jgi:Zn-dependent protease
VAIDPDGANDLFRSGAAPSPAPPTGPIHPRSGLRDTLRRIAAPIGGFALLIAKFAAKAKFLLVLGLKGKYLVTAGTMLVSIGAYTLFWGWRFAALFVLLLFVHELGHAIALRREGIATSPILFVPFLGAVIGMRGRPHDAWVEAKVGLAGPLLGSAGAAAVLVLSHVTGSRLLEAVAFTAFFLNLFNLLPVVPLDGGRAAAALHPLVWILGIAGLAALAIWHPNPILFLFLIIGGMEAWKRLRSWRAGDAATAAYYAVTRGQRTTVAITYLGLAALLVVGMAQSHVHVS